MFTTLPTEQVLRIRQTPALLGVHPVESSETNESRFQKERCLAPCVWATDWRLLYNGFRDWRTHVERLMRSCVIVLSEPEIDDDLGLLGRREPLCIENLGLR